MKLDLSKYTFEKYIEKIATVDKKKAQFYADGRKSAILKGSIERTMECFPKSGEWFVK